MMRRCLVQLDSLPMNGMFLLGEDFMDLHGQFFQRFLKFQPGLGGVGRDLGVLDSSRASRSI